MNNQEGFIIKGESNFISLELIKVFGFPHTTSHSGGYEVRATIVIKSGGFNVNSEFYTSTGELYKFLQQLKQRNRDLSGKASYTSFEGDLELIAEYDNLGHVSITGSFTKFSTSDDTSNRLTYRFLSDQTFINNTISQLEIIYKKYGGLNGI